MLVFFVIGIRYADDDLMQLFELREICAKVSRHAGFVFGLLL